jgi:hypothetical protein
MIDRPYALWRPKDREVDDDLLGWRARAMWMLGSRSKDFGLVMAICRP